MNTINTYGRCGHDLKQCLKSHKRYTVYKVTVNILLGGRRNGLYGLTDRITEC